MKIAFILPNLSGGGAEKAVLKTASALAAEAHEAIIVCFEAQGVYPLPEGVRQMVLLPHGRRMSRGWLGRRLLARRLASCMKALSPDLAVSTLPFADEVAHLAGVRNHWCRIANTLSQELLRLPQRRAARRLARYKALYGKSPLIAVSEGVARDMRGLGATSTIEVIGNPFDAESIREQAAQPLPMSVDGPFVLHVGRFVAQKRHDLLLDAWQGVGGAHRLVLLCDPHPGLEAMIRERHLKDRVLIAGFQPNPYAWMAAADLLVLCSDHEGLPNVLVESLMCGTPVVSTDCPSGPSEILGGWAEDALVPCGDSMALCAAITHGLKVRHDLSMAGLERYQPPRTVASYARLADMQRGLG